MCCEQLLDVRAQVKRLCLERRAYSSDPDLRGELKWMCMDCSVDSRQVAVSKHWAKDDVLFSTCVVLIAEN